MDQMSNNVFDMLTRILVSGEGTAVYPKGDGRVEIPHGIVNLVGWRDKSTIWIRHGHGCLVMSDKREGQPIGHVSVSMGRTRIPMSTLKKVGMVYIKVDVIPDLVSGTVTVKPSRYRCEDRVKAVLRELGVDACAKLLAALSGENNALFPIDDRCAANPKLFLVDSSSPTIVRVIGRPFAFKMHWVPIGNKGMIVLHRDKCPLCTTRVPDITFLIPVIKKRNGESKTGFLFAQEALRTNIARQIAGKNPTEFDLILFYKPYSDGMCSVYKSPVEPMPDDQVSAAMSACADPNAFVANTFQDAENLRVQMVPGRAPTFIIEEHFADEAKPRNLVK